MPMFLSLSRARKEAPREGKKRYHPVPRFVAVERERNQQILDHNSFSFSSDNYFVREGIGGVIIGT